MIEWEPNKNDVNLNMPVDGQVASICWNEQTKLLTMVFCAIQMNITIWHGKP